MLSTRAVSRRIAAVSAAAVTCGLVALAAPAHASTVGGAISPSEIISRAQYWVDQAVPYTESGATHTDGSGTYYREDCSGFVSMAWHLSKSLIVTDPAPDDFTNVDGTPNTNYDTGIGAFTNLQTGDAMAYPHEHIFLFNTWTNKSTGAFTYYAESNPSDPTHGPTPANINNSTLEGWPTSGYVGLRYKNVTSGGSGSAQRTVDVNADGKEDLIAMDTTGTLYSYLSTGTGTVNSAITTGTSFTPYTNLVAGDFDGDGKSDLLGISNDDGNLYFFKGNGNGTVQSAVQEGNGFNGYTHLVAGHFYGTSHLDIAGISPSGVLVTFAGTGTGDVNSGVTTGSGWSNLTKLIAADINGDGKDDLIGINPTGTLNTYTSTGSGTVNSGVVGGTGFGGYSNLVAGDFDGDGKADVMGIADSTGGLYFFKGTGTGTVNSGVLEGNGFNGYTHLIAGHFYGGNNLDIAGISASGVLVTFAGTGTGDVNSAVTNGSGWNNMTTLL